MTRFDKPRRVIALVVSLTFTGVAWAQDSPAAREAAADRYLKVVPSGKMLDDAFAEMAKQLPQNQQARFLADMKAIVNVENVERITREAMVKTFTADELNALADFYGSEHGSSAMKKFGGYIAQIMPVIQAEVQRGVRQYQSQQQKK